MFSLGEKRKEALRSLKRRVPLKALPNVQPIMLLQMVIGLSQVLNGGAAQPEAVARVLVLDGQQRLRALRKAAPHLDLSLSRLLSRIRSSETSNDRLSDEESAVQAMLEVCLGLMLRWLSKRDPHSHARARAVGTYVPCLHILISPCYSSYHPLFRARSCLIS